MATYSKILKNNVIAFVNIYGDDIKNAIKGSGLFFETVVAQKCLESAYGKSKQAKLLNNFGGIIWTRNFPPDITKSSWSIYAKFPTSLKCFQYYVANMKSATKPYTKAGVFSAKSPEEQLFRINEAGYCADPDPKTYSKIANPIIAAVRDLYKVGKVV